MTDIDESPTIDTRQRLPLNAFRAFEACVRLGSMTAAAAELCVTHGAISRHVHALEDQFALPLLQRLPRSVAPTPEGAALASQLTEAFALLQKAAARLAPGPLTLSCSATIMMKWLIPRLSDFKLENPNFEIRLNLSHGEVNFVQDKISLAIRTSFNRPPQDAVIEPLLREQIGPVCHPDYVARAGISSVASLSKARILATATRPNAWPEWMQLMSCREVGLKAHERYEHFYLVIEAAAARLGVALTPRYLVEKELDSGQLVAPFGFIESGHTLNLWIAPHERLRNEVRRLAAWIKERME
jgi:LysR family transcriptional regulator, glycine cleavage system transcriptional activator